jgi:hypothetical protein
MGSAGEAISNNLNRLSGWSGPTSDIIPFHGRNVYGGGFGGENSISSSENWGLPDRYSF